MTTTIRGLVFKGAGQPLAVETLALDPPGPGEVAVRMLASGVCHSDLHVVDGDWARPADIVLGHEGSALVTALGPGVVERFPDLVPGATRRPGLDGPMRDLLTVPTRRGLALRATGRSGPPSARRPRARPSR